MRKKYRPKGVRLDVMAYVQSGLKRFDDVSVAVDLRIKNHAAMEALRTGLAGKPDIDILIDAFNMTEAFRRYKPELGLDWATEIRSGQDALLAVGVRGAISGRFICKAEELVAMNLVMEIHDVQLSNVTVRDMELAMDIIDGDFLNKKVRGIVQAAV